MNQRQELDAKIARRVFGHEVSEDKDGNLDERGSDGQLHRLSAYSSDIAAAWRVVDKVGVTLIPIEDKGWFALVTEQRDWPSPSDFIQYLQRSDYTHAGAAIAATPALAICLAAL